MSPRYVPRPISPKALEIGLSGDIDAMLAYIDAPIDPAITPLDRRFVLTHAQRHYLDSLQPSKVIELKDDALSTYDNARPHLLMSLAEAHEILGNLKESDRFIEDLIHTLPTLAPRFAVHLESMVAMYHYRVGAYRMAIGHCDAALAADLESSPHRAIAATLALRCLAHLDELDRESELSARFDEELEKFSKSGPSAPGQLGPILGMHDLAIALTGARRGDSERTVAALDQLADRMRRMSIPTKRLQKRRLECSMWAWTWLGDTDRALAVYDEYRAFLATHDAPIDRAILLAAAARKYLGLELVGPEDIAGIRHPAIIFHASQLMQDALPNSDELERLRRHGESALPPRLRSHVG